MGYFFDTFYFEPGSRMTGIWQAGVDLDADTELVATASLVRFGRDQHDQLEADFMGSHLPFHFGGFHGVGPDGHPWAMMLQVAPSAAADLVGSDSVYWPMSDGLERALHYNWEAELLSDRGLRRWDLVDIYAERPLRGHTIYCMAKAALHMMTASLARELGPEVRVNGVALSAGDAVKIENETTVRFENGEKAEVLLFDLAPLQ